MSRFSDVPDQYDPHAVEERVFEYWDDVDAYEQTRAHREDGEPFFFVDGPPYTSGAAHMGTTWNKALKDAIIRYKRMQGHAVTDRPGYDMHGLPIETKVEEELGFESKKDIEDYGVENFIEDCKSFANRNLDAMDEDFMSFGVWMDWENPYKTVDPTYMEAAWWGFKRAHERGLVEQGKRSSSQCPRCETGLANNEVEYEDVEDPSIYVTFDLVDRDGSLVAWTTTPWTIPANEYVAVDEELTYQQIRAVKTAGGPEGQQEEDVDVLIVAEDCVEGVLRAGRYDDYEVVDSFPGAKMLGWEYEHPLAEEVPDNPVDAEGTCEVYHGDWVEADKTGLVHSAPGHGEDDFVRGRELGLPIFCPVGGDGVYTEEGGKYAGTFVRDANEDIIEDLARTGHLLAHETITHSYGHCWRCDTGIIQIVTDQWYITITDVKDELLENMEDSEWYPSWARDSRFRDFIESAPDWNVSRQRYWGIPLPIWVPESADSSANGSGGTAGGWSGEMADVIVVGTREELAELADQDLDPETVDIHKPTVDDVTITVDDTTYERVPDVFDVWLDSSVATWGTLDYPEVEDDFEALWPADLIVEAHDQTRGWFWSQLGMGTAAMGEVPYREVLMHGHALDENGRKMSKSVGNIVQPGEAIERHGADAMRAFLLSQTPQGDDMRFSWEEMENVKRELNILWNVFRFPLPYMRMDGFDPSEVGVDDVSLEREDQWVLSRLQQVKYDAENHWDDYETHLALRAILDFVVDDVSRYYVQQVRERMWAEEESESKTAAYATLYRVLHEVVRMLAPYAPFITEEIYGHLTGGDEFDTVHMADWPEVEERYRQPALEDQIAVVREVEEAGSNARQQAGRKLRWPVTRVVVAANEDRVVQAVREHTDLVAERLNAREVELVDPDDAWGELDYSANADMSVLGPAFGGDAGAVMNALNDASIDRPSLDALEESVEAQTGLDVELTPEMVEFVEDVPEDVAAASFDGGTVYVDTELSEDVESEGYAREVIRRVQELRKDLDLAMDADIELDVEVFDERVARLVSQHESLIAEETRAVELTALDDPDVREEYEVEGVTMRLGVNAV